MKKLLLLVVVFSITFLGYSQKRVMIPKEYQNYAVKTVHVDPLDDALNLDQPVNPTVRPIQKSDNGLWEDEVIGKTFYDLQTNTMLENRFYYYPDDGTMAGVWTMGLDGAPNFPERGTGYNYFDGTSWGDIPTESIENALPARTGWPNYAPLGPDGELVVAHLASGLQFSHRSPKGTGDWNFFTFMGPSGAPDLTWPRVATGGTDNNTIHLLANSYAEYQGQATALLYSRGQFDGSTVTWDIENVILDGTGSDYYNEINADEYVWADQRGGAIAFLVANAWHDMFMMKSTDNGDTWEKTVIWEHPYPFFDWETTITDTLYCVDNSATITLDNDGMAHVVFGINRVLHDEVGTTYSYFPYVDGVGYWNENMPTFSNNLHALDPYGHPDSELVVDENLIAYMWDMNENGELDYINYTIGDYSYRELGPVTMPTITINDYGQIAVFYSSLTEDYVWNDLTLFRHIWARGSNDLGETWLDIFLDIDGSIIHSFDECIYPVTTTFSDNEHFNVMYQADNYPGVALDEIHDYVENQMYYAKVHKFEVIGEEEFDFTEEMVGVFPNPVSDYAKVDVVLPANGGEVSITVTNLIGQTVYNNDFGYRNTLNNQTINFSQFDQGVYFLTVEVNESRVTKKLIIE